MFKASEESQTTNLQYLVLSLKVFFFIGVTLRKLVDVDPELLDFLFDLQHTTTSLQLHDIISKTKEVDDHYISDSTFCFFLHTSAGVRQSALANTGTMLTFSCRAFIHSTSRGRRLRHIQTCVNAQSFTCGRGTRWAEVSYPWLNGEMKYRQQWTLLSCMFLLFKPLSSLKYCSNCWSM